MGFEVDFLPVGEKFGDAISGQYGQPGSYTAIIYDRDKQWSS